MSLVIASTTDTQEAVNAAAGIGTPPKPSEAPVTGEPEAPGDPESPDEDTPDQDTEQDDPEDAHKPKRKWGANERIARITREKYQYQARAQELERRLAEVTAARPERPSPVTPQQQYTGEPAENQFERYEDYVRALSQYHAAAAYQQMRAVDMQRQAQYQAAQQHTVWQDRVASFREATPDFDTVLEDAEHIQLSPVLQQAILEHENGARLAYELAKDQKTLERISRLSHTAAVRELGKFEAKLDLTNGVSAPKPPPVSKAPPPISPVGQGSSRSTKSIEDMNYQEYKQHWARTHPVKR